MPAPVVGLQGVGPRGNEQFGVGTDGRRAIRCPFDSVTDVCDDFNHAAIAVPVINDFLTAKVLAVIYVDCGTCGCALRVVIDSYAGARVIKVATAVTAAAFLRSDVRFKAGAVTQV